MMKPFLPLFLWYYPWALTFRWTQAYSSQELLHEMGIGWNLGNTLEAFGDWITGTTPQAYETAWGNPVTTEAMIQAVRGYGFRTVRIPVAWSNLMEKDGTYTINALLLKRVEEVVGYALKHQLFVILNIHYDGGWWTQFADDTTKEEAFRKYKRIWEQVAEYYREYDEHLIFESLNEEGCFDTLWNRYSMTGDKGKAYGLLNQINQTFVEIVRESGGRNTERHLLLAGYCTDIDLTVDWTYTVPQDSQQRVMVSVHYYTPSSFTLLEEDADWGKAETYWGSTTEINYLKSEFNKLKSRFVDQGIPVIIGEFGVTASNKDPESHYLFLRTVTEYALELGICPIVWDHGQYFNRKALTFKDPTIGKLFQEIDQSLNLPPFTIITTTTATATTATTTTTNTKNKTTIATATTTTTTAIIKSSPTPTTTTTTTIPNNNSLPTSIASMAPIVQRIMDLYLPMVSPELQIFNISTTL
ncbi:glycoside hydrolase family 5 protein [Piromyces sp. E2]|nr:glycoside hydrolase family 5 protein [Piromyces sp. E2]|eukprot:OUM66551.1 glycoside hydrolase family 5 protein [Piromyces sp. E2]